MITKFKDFINESYFHTMEDIDKILDKITEIGYENLSDSDIKILNNYSKDDEDIKEILTKINEMIPEFKKINKEIEDIMQKGGKKEDCTELIRKWTIMHAEMNKYEHLLQNVYKLEDQQAIRNYMEKNL